MPEPDPCNVDFYMRDPARRVNNLALSPAGVGPLLQRDYWAVISGCRLKPSEVVDWVARYFSEFSPPDRAIFSMPLVAPLQVGDELHVKIRWAGSFRIRVLHQDRNSMTLGTIRGHPEAGRITFGAYRNDFGDVIFHIRSRARSSSRRFLAGFLAIGDPMQLHTWTDFVNNVALSAGNGVVGFVHAESCKMPKRFSEEAEASRPTFVAQGD